MVIKDNQIKLLLCFIELLVRKMVGMPGIEPGLYRLSSDCFNQLSYTPINTI